MGNPKESNKKSKIQNMKIQIKKIEILRYIYWMNMKIGKTSQPNIELHKGCKKII